MYAYANLREEKETEKAILVQDAYTPHMTYIQSPHPLPHSNTIPTYNSPFPPLSPPKAPNTSPPYTPTCSNHAPLPVHPFHNLHPFLLPSESLLRLGRPLRPIKSIKRHQHRIPPEQHPSLDEIRQRLRQLVVHVCAGGDGEDEVQLLEGALLGLGDEEEDHH